MTTSFFARWKNLFAAVAAVGGIAVPIWLWQADLNARSLALTVVHTISLLPMENVAPGRLELSIDGQPLASPYFSLIEVENTGKRPIAAADFEGPIEIRVASGQTIARARVTESIPGDLEAKLVTEREKLLIHPLLLNPGDRLIIGVITSGSPPKYSTRARIAGVTSAAINDVSSQKRSHRKQIALGVSGFALLVASMLFFWRTLELKGTFVRTRAALFVAPITFFLGECAVIFLLDGYGYGEFWQSLFIILLLSAIAGGVAAWLNRPEVSAPPK
jgi:hypothetical protein